MLAAVAAVLNSCFFPSNLLTFAESVENAPPFDGFAATDAASRLVPQVAAFPDFDHRPITLTVRLGGA
jgi:hypothetical protein